MLNTDKVKSLAHSNPTTSAIFLALSQRERGRQVINVTLFKRKLRALGVTFDEKDFYQTFKDLQSMQLGDLVYGRRGNPDSFIWHYDLKDVVRVGLGEAQIAPKSVMTRPSRGTGVRSSTPNTVRPRGYKRVKTAISMEKAINETVKLNKAATEYVQVSIPIELLKLIKLI